MSRIPRQKCEEIAENRHFSENEVQKSAFFGVTIVFDKLLNAEILNGVHISQFIPGFRALVYREHVKDSTSKVRGNSWKLSFLGKGRSKVGIFAASYDIHQPLYYSCTNQGIISSVLTHFPFPRSPGTRKTFSIKNDEKNDIFAFFRQPSQNDAS